MKLKGIKKAFNAFISGILISSFITVPTMNVNASSSSWGPKSYFTHGVPDQNSIYHNYSYYNRNSITTAENINGNDFAIAQTVINPTDGHTYYPGEVRIKVRLYTDSGYKVLETNYISNTSNHTTSFSVYRSSTDVFDGINYYSKGITEVYTGTGPDVGYCIEHTYISPSLGDFTY